MSDVVLKGEQDFLAIVLFPYVQNGPGYLLPAVSADLQPPIQNRVVNL